VADLQIGSWVAWRSGAAPSSFEAVGFSTTETDFGIKTDGIPVSFAM
jgi:hypothetical protein